MTADPINPAPPVRRIRISGQKSIQNCLELLDAWVGKSVRAEILR